MREFPKGRLELIKIGGATIGRAVFEPGWRWATSVQPIAKTSSCEAPHFQYHVAGVLRIRMDDGSEFDCRPGDVSLLPSGHDAWVIGNEAAVVVDFQGTLDCRITSNRALPTDKRWPSPKPVHIRTGPKCSARRCWKSAAAKLSARRPYRRGTPNRIPIGSWVVHVAKNRAKASREPENKDSRFERLRDRAYCRRPIFIEWRAADRGTVR